MALDEAGQNSANTGAAKGVCKYCGEERLFQVNWAPKDERERPQVSLHELRYWS